MSLCFLHAHFMPRHHRGKKLARKWWLKKKWRMCFQSDTKKRLVRTCLKKINLSPNFLDTHLCGSYSISSTSYSFFFFWNPSYRAYFQPLFLYGLSFTTKFLCDPFHRAHHGNLVRPGKNAPQRTQGHILYKKRGGKASGSFFLSFSFFPPSFPAAPLLAWQKKKKAQDRVCVARKPLLFIDRETRMTEWPTHLH